MEKKFVNEFRPKGGWAEYYRRQNMKAAAIDAFIASTFFVASLALIAILG